jgi:flagellar export protein FliJ
MKGLSNLIRLHRWKLDEKRRQMVDLERLKAELEAQAVRLKQDMAAEAEIVRGSRPEMRFGYSTWLESALLRRDTIEQSLNNLSAQIVQCHDEVTAAFQDVKRYEMVAESQERQARSNAARLEQADHDETGVDQFRRRTQV